MQTTNKESTSSQSDKNSSNLTTSKTAPLDLLGIILALISSILIRIKRRK